MTIHTPYEDRLGQVLAAGTTKDAQVSGPAADDFADMVKAPQR
ncbi:MULTISPECIES: hypothetical protein [Mycobacteriaceae]|uniref:Uncharacterized protein n=1 Tax=Mycolicibacterium nivoides TaxID=2487344 RepID=A0ABW9LL00_9MYCO|nr:hypothetical protein [Mycobacterium syngnathidarum]